MTIFDILYYTRKIILRLRRADIRLNDADYFDLFVDVNDKVARGEKVSFAVTVLAEAYLLKVEWSGGSNPNQKRALRTRTDEISELEHTLKPFIDRI